MFITPPAFIPRVEVKTSSASHKSSNCAGLASLQNRFYADTVTATVEGPDVRECPGCEDADNGPHRLPCVKAFA